MTNFFVFRQDPSILFMIVIQVKGNARPTLTSARQSQCCWCCGCCCPRGCVQTANIANIATTAITTISQDLGDLSPGLVSHSTQCSLSLYTGLPPSYLRQPVSDSSDAPALGHRATGKHGGELCGLGHVSESRWR